MLDLLAKLVTPIAQSMGASASDVTNYINLVGGYIYAILGLIVALIVVMVGAHFVVKKGYRHLVRWTGAVAFVLALLLVVNLVCYGPLYNALGMVLNAKPLEISDDVAGNSWNVSAQVGDEGIVLLKNNGLLPLSDSTSKLNVFGWASVNAVYSGTGSAAAGEAAVSRVTLLGSLKDAGYEMNNDLVSLYLNYASSRPSITMNKQDWTLPEPTKDAYTSLMSGATAFSDTAIIVIARSGGENADLPADMNAVIKGTYDLAGTDAVYGSSAGNYGYTAGVYKNNGNYDDFEPGEHYLELSRTEEDLVETVCSNFKNVIVVINANNAMELGWVEQYDNIGAVLLVPGTGDAAMGALGRILSGEVNPSGKTVDTYLYDLTKAPNYNNSGNSGNHLYNDGLSNLLRNSYNADMSFQGVVSFVDYVEGIYMGYKYYETASDEGVINYSDYVQYPFGYGLSYTSFKQEITSFNQNDTAVTVEVTVTNEGSVAGKTAVELYYTPPYNNGGIEKASVNLIDFGKTEMIEPGQTAKVSFTVPLENMASYDSTCIKTANGGYILEAGEYVMSIRSDSHTVLDSRSFTLNADKDYSADGRPSDELAPVNRFDYAVGDATYLSRANKFANYDAATAAPAAERFKLDSAVRKAIEAITVTKYDPTEHDDPNDVMPTLGAAGNLKLADLSGKDYDDPMWDQLLDQLTIEEMTKLINVGGWQTARIESIDKIRTADADGPTGLSVYTTGQMGTQFPAVPMMAQTWNKELAEKIGEAMGQEFAAANNYGWYGPAVNLHRSAFSGRNYEYYSEDPMLSGLFASAEVNGAAKYGVYSYLKHFAANDQETNRCAYLMTHMTEQTLRETVLKPFETVVKNFDFDNYVMGMMTSYNWLGSVPVISNHDLLTDVLRGEWGFTGMVISDYNGSYGYQLTDAAIRAGNDLMLGQGASETNKLTDTDAATCVLAMRQATKNILYTVGNSGYYTDPSAVQTGDGDSMDSLFMTINIIVIAIALVVEAIVVVRFILKRRKTAKD